MQLSHEPLSIALSEPFVSHKGVTTSLRHVLVKVTYGERVGFGVGVPAKEFGQSESTIVAALNEYARVVAEHSPFEHEAMLRRLERTLPGQSSALAAVDMAVHDLLGQIAGLPLHRLLGLDGLPLPDSGLSLGVMSAAEAQERARKLAGWPILKLKMSAPDEPLVRAVREVYSGRLWIDGNGSWTPKQAVVAAEQFHRHGVELLEQPIAPGSPESLRFVRDRVPMSVVADEDCVGPADVAKLAGCVDAVGIKLLKCGGIRRAYETIQLARRAGLKVMLGCKTESVLGITAIAHLGGLADYLDLDGHLDLVADPFDGVKLTEGKLTMPTTPGLGVRRREAKERAS